MLVSGKWSLVSVTKEQSLLSAPQQVEFWLVETICNSGSETHLFSFAVFNLLGKLGLHSGIAIPLHFQLEKWQLKAKNMLFIVLSGSRAEILASP